MSQQMTITRVMEGDEWGNDYGRNQSYTLDLQLEDGSVVQDIVSNRKIRDDGSHKEPQEQEVVWGDLLPMPKGQRKLKLDYDAMKEHGSGSPSRSSRPSESSTGSKSSGGETDWTIRNAEIRRQHSQEMAVRVLTATGALSDPQAKPDHISAWIKQWADEFDQDAIAAGQKASQGQSPSTFPSDSGSLAASDSPSADDTGQWLENLLIQGGASTYGAGTLARYALEKLRPDDLQKCEALLGNLDTIGEGTKRLEASYEKAEGEPVPQEDPDEEPLPF